MASFASTASAVPSCGGGGARRCVVARASAVAMAPAALGTAARTHYEVLGVGAGASRGEIKAAYRRLAREVHPDAAGGGSGDEGFIQLHAAYATLADPDERARLKSGGNPEAAMPPSNPTMEFSGDAASLATSRRRSVVAVLQMVFVSAAISWPCWW